MSEDRIVNAFRAEYHRNRRDLEAFDLAYAGQTFADPAECFHWCRAWWEERLQGRALDHGERRLRGQQGQN